MSLPVMDSTASQTAHPPPLDSTTPGLHLPHYGQHHTTRSTSGRYASYWNAFLFSVVLCPHIIYDQNVCKAWEFFSLQHNVYLLNGRYFVVGVYLAAVLLLLSVPALCNHGRPRVIGCRTWTSQFNRYARII